jgi:hypothetical protein
VSAKPGGPAGKPADESPEAGKKKMTGEQAARLKKAAEESGKEEAEDDTLSQEGAEQRIDMLKGRKPKDQP